MFCEQNQPNNNQNKAKIQDSIHKQKDYKSQRLKFSSRYAITFGQVSIVHIGSEQLGKKAEYGFNIQQLKQLRQILQQRYGIDGQLVNLTDLLPQKHRVGNQAAVLYLPNAVDLIVGQQGFSDQLYKEQQQIDYDVKYYDTRRKRTLNKKARYNIVFGEDQRKRSQNYQQFSVKAFRNLKYLNKFRQEIGQKFGKKAQNLNAEGNRYYESKSGIGFHGDSQRKIVICLNLGKTSTLRYYWRMPYSSQNKYGPTDITVSHGDIYIMSEKATGNDWKFRSKFRLVHAAGSEKYIGKTLQN